VIVHFLKQQKRCFLELDGESGRQNYSHYSPIWNRRFFLLEALAVNLRERVLVDTYRWLKELDIGKYNLFYLILVCSSM